MEPSQTWTNLDGTAAQFAEVRAQFAGVGARLEVVGARTDSLRGEIGVVATVVRDLAQVVARHYEDIARHDQELEEHRRQIRQIFSRMEQSDACFEVLTHEIREMRLDIRRILDGPRWYMECQGGDGGGRRQQPGAEPLRTLTFSSPSSWYPVSPIMSAARARSFSAPISYIA